MHQKALEVGGTAYTHFHLKELIIWETLVPGHYWSKTQALRHSSRHIRQS